MKNPNILGLATDLPMIKKNVSCTGNLLNVGLKNKKCLSTIIEANLYGILRNYAILRNMSPNMEAWKLKFHLDTHVREMRSRNAMNKITLYKGKYDAVIQIGSEFNVAGLIDKPTFSYHDNNISGLLKSSWKIPNINKKYIEKAFEYETRVYKNLSGIFTMTEHLRKIFIQDFKVPREKVFNVGVGFNFENIHVEDKKYTSKMVLFVARHLFEQKGGKVVLEAFQKVKNDLKEAKLVLVGQKLKINKPGVTVIDFLDKNTQNGKEQLHKLYQEASVFVMPSYSEGLGNVFLEAMAHKVPCIGSDCCSMPEIIVENNAGFVIKPGDANELAQRIIQILKNKELSKELGENGAQAINNKYNWEVVSNKVLKIVNDFIHN